MSPFFNHKGTTYAFANIKSIGDIYDYPEVSTFEIFLSDKTILQVRYQSTYPEKENFSIEHKQKVENIHKEFKKLWAEFLMSIPQIG